MFDWTGERCDDNDIPDAPARAFRDSRGRVHLIVSHFETRELIGSGLNQVTLNRDLVRVPIAVSRPRDG